MEGIEEKLGALLGNPQLMQQIMAMANSLGGGDGGQPKPGGEASSAPESNLLASLAGLAGQNRPDANQKALLCALGPYLSRDRISRLEKAMRAASLAKLASAFLDQGGLSFLTGR